MRKRDGRRQESEGLSRREFFTRPLGRLFQRPAPPWREGAAPGLIPISALREVPETVIMGMVPVLRAGWTVHICQAGVAYRDSAGQEGLVPLDSEGCFAVSKFDGLLTLEEVAAAVASEYDMLPAAGATLVREAFLALAMSEVFHPDRPLDPLTLPQPEE